MELAAGKEEDCEAMRKGRRGLPGKGDSGMKTVPRKQSEVRRLGLKMVAGRREERQREETYPGKVASKQGGIVE